MNTLSTDISTLPLYFTSSCLHRLQCSLWLTAWTTNWGLGNYKGNTNHFKPEVNYGRLNGLNLISQSNTKVLISVSDMNTSINLGQLHGHLWASGANIKTPIIWFNYALKFIYTVFHTHQDFATTWKISVNTKFWTNMGSKVLWNSPLIPSDPLTLHDTIGPHSKNGLWAQTENLIKFCLLLFKTRQIWGIW